MRSLSLLPAGGAVLLLPPAQRDVKQSATAQAELLSLLNALCFCDLFGPTKHPQLPVKDYFIIKTDGSHLKPGVDGYWDHLAWPLRIIIMILMIIIRALSSVNSF